MKGKLGRVRALRRGLVLPATESSAEPVTEGLRAGGILADDAAVRVGAASPARQGGAGGSEKNSLRRQGEFWTFVFRGRVVHVQDRKGMRQLWCLLSQPGEEIAAIDLAGLPRRGAGPARMRPPPGAPSARIDCGHAGPAADRFARREYLRHARLLSDQADEAENAGEREKAALIREELDQLRAELSASFRRGGGARLQASVLERARVSVRNNIASVLRAIRGEDEPLWRHLFSNVHTGAFCSYRADDPIACD